MRGYIDLHCHYLPAIDDGVRTIEDGVALVRGLHAIGFETVVATPHIRTAMFENRAPGLRIAFQAFTDYVRDVPDLPELGLGAEHFCDDVFLGLLLAGELQPYPGGKAALVELPVELIPRRVEERFFEMAVRGFKPVLAHPERYTALFKTSDPIDPMLEVGVLPLLDVMSLVGRYGRSAQRAAERMLSEGVYYAACSDCHRPGDVDIVSSAIERLRALVGAEDALELLSANPKHILEGTVES